MDFEQGYNELLEKNEELGAELCDMVQYCENLMSILFEIKKGNRKENETIDNAYKEGDEILQEYYEAGLEEN